MPRVKVPHEMTLTLEAHEKWVKTLKDAQELVEADVDMQEKCAAGLRLKERNVPAEVLGRAYAQYCVLINRMYDAYLNNVQLQRAGYMKEVISVFLKRLYELRNEIVHYIVNDYIYVDESLIQMKLTPADIQIVIPYHYPLECRADASELLLQKMWLEAENRKNAPLKTKRKAKKRDSAENSDQSSNDEDDANVSEAGSEHTIIPEDFTQVSIIQRHERFRQSYMMDFKAKCAQRRTYFATKTEEAPLVLKTKAARLIQKTYRKFMQIKRQRVLDMKRDMLIGLVPNPWAEARNYEEENNKIYERRRQTRSKLHEIFLKEMEKERIRLIVFKKEDQIDDITDEIRQWFREWYYGYGFFPEFPYEIEGGTLLVVRGDFPSIEEKIEADEKYLAATKGKTKDQIKQEAAQAKADAKMRAEAEKEKQKKEALNLLKLRCDPFGDPGYEIKASAVKQGLIEALQKYRSAWSIHDRCPPGKEVDVVYGFMQSYLTEDLMKEMHLDCRKYVDELMRLDLKLLIKMQQLMYKRVGWKFPKVKPRKKPKITPVPKPLMVDGALMKQIEPLFDMGLISKPTTRLKDVYGDSSYAAYEYNVRDPNATFPLPGYGDVKRRIVYSCVYGVGMDPGATRLKAVMLLGPPRNGKTFLVEAAAGELNAVKIDITPEVFSAKLEEKPARLLGKVLLAARAFQPAIIFMRNVERVFAKKVLPEDKYLNATQMKAPLAKLVKAIYNEDKVIFIATCSDPMSANRGPLVSLFNETILVPRTDYGSLQQFFYNKLQSTAYLDGQYLLHTALKLGNDLPGVPTKNVDVQTVGSTPRRSNSCLLMTTNMKMLGVSFIKPLLEQLPSDVRILIRSMPRDFNVQVLAQMLQGYGFGYIVELFDRVMNADRIVRLNVTPLLLQEFVDPLLDDNIEPITMEDYQVYVDFFIQNHPTLKRERDEYSLINQVREVMYTKAAEKKKKKEKKE